MRPAPGLREIWEPMPHGLHIRLPKNFVLEERLERYSAAIETNPYAWCGMWAWACAPVGSPAFREVRLDLGCGRGSFTVEMARREPDVLFIGMDAEPICIAYAAQAGCDVYIVTDALEGDVNELNKYKHGTFAEFCKLVEDLPKVN